MEKLLDYSDEPICLFCGNKKVNKFDDGEFYYECDCADAKRNREIDEEIRILSEQRPKRKFQIVDVRMLREIQ